MVFSPQIDKVKIASERAVLRRRLAALNKRVDQLLYGLFGVDADGIAVIERLDEMSAAVIVA